jgi:hypothetical protein
LSDEEEARAASKQFFKDVSSRPMHHELASQPYSPLITLMTVDFLLTARDLPGWPGLVPTIDFRSVLKKSVAELENTGYGQERLCRELRILHHVAIRHGLEPFFRRSVRRASRRAQRAALTGTGVNRKTIYVDGAAYNIHNIFDAAYVARALCQMAEDWSVRTLFRSGCTALVNRLRATRRISPFPAETEWSGAALEGIGGGPQNAGAEWPG